MLMRKTTQASTFYTTNLTYQSNGASIRTFTDLEQNQNKFHTRIQSLHSIDSPIKKLDNKGLEKQQHVAETKLKKLPTSFWVSEKLQRLKNDMEAVVDSKSNIQLKIKMLESIRDSLQTHVKCVKNKNHELREKITYFENLPTLQNIMSKKEHNIDKETGNNTSSSLKNKTQSRDSEENEKSDDNCSFVFNSLENIEDLADEYNKIEELREENLLQEDTILHLRHTKKSLSVSVDDLRDELTDLQALINEKKRVLENKIKYIEEKKIKLSQDTSEKNSSQKLETTDDAKDKPNTDSIQFNVNPQKKEFVENPVRTNYGLFQGMSSKLSGFVDNMFGKKPNRSVLTPEVLQEINLTRTPSVVTENKLLSRSRNRTQTTSTPNSIPYY